MKVFQNFFDKGWDQISQKRASFGCTRDSSEEVAKGFMSLSSKL